jgi:uncharacterized protein involved in exopolysaccharide biosynthesis
MDFRFYLALFRRRLHWFFVVLVLVAAGGIALARLLPTVYVASAKLVVESEEIPDAMAASTVDVQATEQLQIIQQRILTRDTLVEMANRLQIYEPVAGQPVQPLDADEIVANLRSRISIVTTGGTQARGPVQATLVDVSFEAPTAAMAAAVTNDVVTLILRADVEMRTGSARDTLDFFKQEVARLDTELTERGAAILAFKEANLAALPDSVEFRRGQLAAAQERLLEIQRAEDELRDRRDRLVRVHESTGGTADTTPVQQQTPEERQLNELRNQMTAQLAVLAPGNPRIRLLESQITALEAIVAQQGNTGGVDSQGRELTAFEVQLADVDGQLAHLEQQRSQIVTDMQALQVSINATPGNAIALDALQRDYDNTRVQYDQAVANKARAETGDTIEALSKGQRISVIEQAVAPREPARPNRPLIAAGGVGGGIALGLALVALLEFLNRGIRRPEDLNSALGITPFATLPYYDTMAERRGLHLRQVAKVFIVLLVLGLLAWAVNRYYMPLDLLLDRLIGRFALVNGSLPDRV